MPVALHKPAPSASALWGDGKRGEPAEGHLLGPLASREARAEGPVRDREDCPGQGKESIPTPAPNSTAPLHTPPRSRCCVCLCVVCVCV